MSRLDSVLNGANPNLLDQREPRLELRFHPSRREVERVGDTRMDAKGLSTG
jgi:hypothetical protein